MVCLIAFAKTASKLSSICKNSNASVALDNEWWITAVFSKSYISLFDGYYRNIRWVDTFLCEQLERLQNLAAELQSLDRISVALDNWALLAVATHGEVVRSIFAPNERFVASKETMFSSFWGCVPYHRCGSCFFKWKTFWVDTGGTVGHLFVATYIKVSLPCADLNFKNFAQKYFFSLVLPWQLFMVWPRTFFEVLKSPRDRYSAFSSLAQVGHPADEFQCKEW